MTRPLASGSSSPLTSHSSASHSSSQSRGPAARLAARRQQLGDHVGTVAALQRDLGADVDDLRSVGEWDPVTARGVETWLEDRGMIFRALRRNRFGVEAAHSKLLAALAARLDRGLHGSIPAPPTPLWTLLPYTGRKACVDHLGHPVVVLSLSDVARDETGSLDELKDWTWWALELVRRALKEYWVDGRRGTGAEGAVLIIDAQNAGYRNLEVELLPTLFNVARDSYPSAFESVYVVNAGWSHRAMWNNILKRLLPRSAVEKITFLESRHDTEAVFDLDTLPKALGGDGPPIDHETMLHHLSISRSRPSSRVNSRAPSRKGSRAPSREPPKSRNSLSRATSATSMADVFFTAPASPANLSRAGSRAPSRKSSHLMLSQLNHKLAMTKHEEEEEAASAGGDPSRAFDYMRGEAPKSPLPDEAASQSPLHRIKSLSDFHLYLSPSRLAHRDLLSDSEDEGARRPSIQRRRSLQPAFMEGSTLAARRAAARNVQLSTAQQNYTYSLLEHHAQGLERYNPEVLTMPALLLPEEEPPATTPTTPADEAEPVPAVGHFAEENPWFGYPVVKTSDGQVRPRYGRNRKRDLIKTLLWLFVIRLQSWRDALERALARMLGLKSLGYPHMNRKRVKAANPTVGLMRTAQEKRASSSQAMVRATGRDWIWMLIGFLLMRGSWAPLLANPLETVGLTGLKDWLGVTLQ